MAQKRNPINAENICSNARVIRSCVAPVLEDISLEHERDLTNSACERAILPTVFILSDEILSRAASLMAGLQVSTENIKKNLNLSNGAIMAEAVITLLAKKGMDRQAAHEILRTASFEAAAGKCGLEAVLLSNATVAEYIGQNELHEAMACDNYSGLCVEKTEQIVGKWEKFLETSKD